MQDSPENPQGLELKERNTNSSQQNEHDMWICTRALAAAQPDNLFSICFRVTHCHKVTHFSTDLPQLSTYVIYYLIKVLRCEGSVVRSVNFLLTHTVLAHQCYTVQVHAHVQYMYTVHTHVQYMYTVHTHVQYMYTVHTHVQYMYTVHTHLPFTVHACRHMKLLQFGVFICGVE